MPHDDFSRTDWLRLIFVITWLVIFVNWPQTTFAITLLVVGSTFIVFNLTVFWFTVVRKEPASSIAPVFGGLFAAVGIALLPVAESWKWAWIPFVVDWGGLPLLLATRYRKHPQQNIIDQCQLAVDSVRDQLGPERFAKATEYISKYDEWLIGLEFAIDWLSDAETGISQTSYDAFEKAYRMMDREIDGRLSYLRTLVSAPDS